MIERIPEGSKRAFERTSHPYYFYEVLMDVPEGLQKILQPSEYAMIKECAQVLHSKKVAYLIGNGTSLYDAEGAVPMFNEHTSLVTVAMPAYEFVAYPPNKMDDESCLIIVSHSGNTPEGINALKYAKEKGVTTMVLSDNKDGKMLSMADYAIVTDLDEPQMPKSRCFIASLLRVHLLALECAKLEGKSTDDLIAQYLEVPALAQKIIDENEAKIKAYAEARAKDDLARVVVLGTGFQYGPVRESSLKFVEGALVYSEAWEMEEFLHGPMYSMKPNELLIVNAITGSSFAKSRLIVSGIRKLSSNTWAITNTTDELEGADFVTVLPQGLPESMYALFTPMVAYLFVYYYSVSLGRNHIDHGPYASQDFMDARWVLRQIEK